MSEITVSSKGQVVLPKAVRDEFGWTAGTKLQLIAGRGQVTLKAKDSLQDRFRPITAEEFLSRRIKVDKPLPDDREIDRIVLAEAARRFNATRR
jgi:AbrB family looped-hinge helix DNA binding protein